MNPCSLHLPSVTVENVLIPESGSLSYSLPRRLRRAKQSSGGRSPVRNTRILTSGSGASLLPCDATTPRTPPLNNTRSQNTPPRNNNTSAYRFNSATATGVPPIEDILQSLRRLNADVQICHASSKRKENRPSPWESMREFSSSNSSSSSMNGFDLLEQSMQSIGREMQSAKKQVKTILSQVRELSGEFLESSSPKLHHHREHVLHQQISKASVLETSVFQQSEIKSKEIVEPALIVQDPVDRREDVNEVLVQKLQEPHAHQMFEETPQPSVKAADDDTDGSKNQKAEVDSKSIVKDVDCVVEVSMQKVQDLSLLPTPKTSPESALQLNHLSNILGIQKVHIQQLNEFKVHIRESNEFEIDYDDKLEMSLCVKEVQDYSIVFPASDTEELSYVVVGNCNLEVNSIPMDVLHLSQVIRMHGEEKERIGVG